MMTSLSNPNKTQVVGKLQAAHTSSSSKKAGRGFVSIASRLPTLRNKNPMTSMLMKIGAPAVLLVMFVVLRTKDIHSILLELRPTTITATKVASTVTNTDTDKYCSDTKKLMPLCLSCIPGLTMNKQTSTCELSQETNKIRKTLFQIAAQRGMPNTCKVYTYLGTDTLRHRQEIVGKILDEIKPKRVLDIGSYTSPIHSFMSFCPESVFMLEPCGELSHKGVTPWMSKEVTCNNGSSTSTSIHNVLPKSIKTFIHEPHLQHFDAVVCIGCDKNFGANWEELMTMPRPLHIFLEFSVMAFQDDYPVQNTTGCSLVQSKDFDFSDCPDCGFHDKKQESQYGKKRKLVIFHCEEFPQDGNREAESKSILAPYCDNVQENTYRSMACAAEENLFADHIHDTALMAVNAMSDMELKDENTIWKRSRNTKKYVGDRACPPDKNLEVSRTWWNTTENSRRLKKAYSFLGNALTSVDPFETMCLATHARNQFTAANPHEMMIKPLYESIKLYQSSLQKSIFDESIDDMGYRFRLKACPPFLDNEYINEVAEMEHILPNGRNLDHREFQSLISFNPYRSLMTFKSVQSRVYRKRILIDVGANGFTASPKQLMDNYAAFEKPFDEVHMFEPDIDGMQYIPKMYQDTSTIEFHHQFVKVATRKIEDDVLMWIKQNVHKDDFLVLKFDVDEGTHGPTMEWGFLGDLIYSDVLTLVDEFYIELHYRALNIRWNHKTHSAR